MTNFLAVWGAVTGTVGVLLAAWGLIWQIRSRQRAPEANLEVQLSLMADKPYLFSNGGVADSVLIHVTNVGAVPVRVGSAGFLAQDSSQRELTLASFMAAPHGHHLPSDVDPRKSLNLLIATDNAAKAIAASKPASAWVRTDSGQRFVSKPHQVIRPGTNGYEDHLTPTMYRSS